MTRDFHIRLHYHLSCLLAFLLPVWPKAVPPVIILVALNYLAGRGYQPLISKSPGKGMLLLFISFYLLSAAGLLWTENFDYAWKDLEIKLSLLALPLLYYRTVLFSREQLRQLLRAFVFGCFVAALVCLVYALGRMLWIKYLISQGRGLYDYGIHNFIGERLSVWIHPSYRSMYFIFALAALALSPPMFRRLHLYAIVPVLIISVFLYNSKAALISLIALGIVLLVMAALQRKKYLMVSVFSGLAVLSAILLFTFVPQLREKISSAYRTLSGETDILSSRESSALRIAAWRASASLVADHPLGGAGTGDVRDVLKKRFGELGMTAAMEEDMNPHNLFLQGGVALGIPGMLLLLLMLLLPMIRSWKERNALYFFFLALFVFNALFESMFETQAGVVYYAFFNALFTFSVSPGNKSPDANSVRP